MRNLLGKTVEMIDVGDVLLIRFTDGSYLEVNSDTHLELNGDERTHVEVWHEGKLLSNGRAE